MILPLTLLRPLATTVLAVSLLTACAGMGGRNGPYYPAAAASYERQVITTLVDVKVDDGQRQKVLAAFDQLGPVLKKNDSDSTALRQRWQQLNPRDADYLSQSAQIADDSARLGKERLNAQALFNQQVASVLNDGQWSRWTELMNAESAAYEDGRGYGGGRRSRR